MRINVLIGVDGAFSSYMKKSSSLIMFLLMACTISISSCSGPERKEGEKHNRQHMVQSLLWFQTAAENRALQYQAFNIARIVLDQDLSRPSKDSKKRAIIVDVDETILDNSRYEGKMILEKKEYPYKWDEWIDLAVAEPIPGSIEFLSYAASKGASIFYVTNRNLRDKEGTLANLQRMGFPQATEDHLLLKTESSSKERRRKKISETHRIVFLMGDNLNDFAQIFEKRTLEDRKRVVDSVKVDFGTRFIILPNPLYGDWEDANFEYNRALGEVEKEKRRIELLRSF